MEIGAGKLTNGSVFHFLREQACHVSTASFELLHKHLGYSSFPVIKQINGVSSSNNALDNCYICFQAK